MKKRLAALLVPVGALLVVFAAGAALAQEGAGGATAELRDNEGNFVGNAEFLEGPEGVAITVNI